MSHPSPFRIVPLFVLLLGLLVLAWAAFAGGGKASTPRMFEEGLTFEQASERSFNEGKPVFAVFSATWCGPCQAFKKGALSDSRVEKFVKDNFIPAYVDVDEQKSAARMFKVSSIPAIAVIKGTERVRGAIGLMNADELIRFLEEAQKDAKAKKPGA
ncbi:MAG: thioredoxin family protein [Phycisphaerae bacterium]|nr:thioredoxin family protein [Phycisphaerae bacterium]